MKARDCGGGGGGEEIANAIVSFVSGADVHSGKYEKSENMGRCNTCDPPVRPARSLDFVHLHFTSDTIVPFYEFRKRLLSA